MLALHGERAWRLLRVVDCADDVEGVERVARALAIHGDQMLRVNESCGPALALLFIPQVRDDKEILPDLFVEAMRALDVTDAQALFVANYDDLARLVLEEGQQPAAIVNTFRLLGGQPEAVRALAADSGLVVRLLLEHRGRDPIGVDIFKRCGPEAADLLFEKAGYASWAEEKPAALAVLTGLGWPGVELLHELRDVDSWHRLLRRPELLDADPEPLIVRLAGRLRDSAQREELIERYLGMPREQIVEQDLPPTLAEPVLAWIPGYVAARTVYDLSRGYHVENSEIALALVDGFSAPMFYGKLAAQAIKTVGTQGIKAEVQAEMRNVERDAVRSLTAGKTRQATETISSRIPGAIGSLMRILPQELPRMEVTGAMRSASGLAKKVGIRTWGKLDRRIIMRGDRRVVIDLFDPKVVTQVGGQVKDRLWDELKDQIRRRVLWSSSAAEPGPLETCMMERVLPGLSSPEEIIVAPPIRPSTPIPPPLPAAASRWRSMLPVAGGVIVVALALVLPRVRTALGRAFARGTKGSKPLDRRPRPYRE